MGFIGILQIDIGEIPKLGLKSMAASGLVAGGLAGRCLRRLRDLNSADQV